ncbi:MAG: signal recognition particle-docking protein FtsY [Candidatus Diapherotrites archaeon]|uniref:Signal recognition particle-docking protein FtsY n=1 Tax=Candidatus Iainarchaeum sp. TaxID=3101447 RepID=A0A8T3YLD6_9ARCH|nr:signal recognition particle-docking protein FtsY [Candidatus Diapherotrites archaeon]
MFDFLKKKISGFTEKLKETLQAKRPNENPADAGREEKPAEAATATTPPESVPQPPKIKSIETPAAPEQEKTKEEPQAPEEKPARKERGRARKITSAAKEPKTEEAPEEEAAVAENETGAEGKAAPEKIREGKEDGKRELRARTGILTKIGGFLGGKIKVTEPETREFFDEFELSLLESDVEQDTANAIVKELRERLVGKEIPASADLTKFLKQEIRASLEKIMETPHIDLLAAGKRPTKVLFLGPNGAGKTTTIAKIAKMLMTRGRTCILAAGDTFRAASIEQLETHAARLGIKVVKHQYGSDPAAVAFDAVKAAQAKGIDFVLIDTAGRQETNTNLLGELRKIVRVVQPDMKIYVGEAYTGQALLEQASEFDAAIGIDGFVLTKIDTDAKGGTAISLLHKLHKPILYIGTGQGHDDLLEFRPGFIIDRII